MTDKPMSHAEIVRKAAAALEWEGISDELCPDLERIAKRLEEIDAPKFVIPLHYFQACSDAGVPITWVVGEEKPT